VGIQDRDHIHCETREQWRTWLSENGTTSPGVWLVTWKKHTGKPTFTYDDSVCEAIAFGWVDSRPGVVDDERSKGYYSPRKATSAWSRTNKERVERLRAEGLMAPEGEAVIAAAIANGSWEKLDAVEDLVEPDELAAGLDQVPSARAAWDSFPRGVKRGILEWISLAKRDETRAQRIQETIAKASVGERANQWRPQK
jgi:uncharacterized protein YdeI (YjbR/CyaY-like superfamily)